VKESVILGRPDYEVEWKPDIDLSFDSKISRKHARLFFRDGHWWIEDVGSKRGTVVKGEEIKEREDTTRLSPGEKVIMGETTWILELANPIRIKYQMVSAINYARHPDIV
jgi:pSer/pThr/pTyr-binding forkhead associated (FHA) protein